MSIQPEAPNLEEWEKRNNRIKKIHNAFLKEWGDNDTPHAFSYSEEAISAIIDVLGENGMNYKQALELKKRFKNLHEKISLKATESCVEALDPKARQIGYKGYKDEDPDQAPADKNDSSNPTSAHDR